VGGHRIFVVATTLAETRHALEMAQSLAHHSDSALSVVVPLVTHATIGSARANVHDLDVADLDTLDPELSVSSVRALFTTWSLEPEIIVVPTLGVPPIASVVPADSTVIVCGPMHRFFETRQQRIVRELAKRLQDVVFLPFPDTPRAGENPQPETDVMRHLVC
jgi:RES domain-containing protein